MSEKRGGFWRRLAAGLVDGILIGLFCYGITVGMDQGTANATETVVNLLYATLLPLVWGGYTFGKRLLYIRIARTDFLPLSLGTMLLREVFGKMILSLITFGITVIISAFMILLREDRRAIHDLIAGTYVEKSH
ncbi:RDD family protein [Ammoniphilus sp. CFH 90114]|uniref:RDD family protein n=1 Tax=Ammoniphilus sp. CFH 90114 TaxID=2493665 RepID=UPI00100DE1CD|nr:RDD family protein [Ammoniphilus sp. CFH 90114]RXT14938.1 RDD family protein [Ammoniphilus sp. CFH 90114]